MSNSEINRYNRYINNILNIVNKNYLYDFKNKELNNKLHILDMLNRTNSIFTYNNLPETIPERILENILQTKGNCIFTKHNDKFVILTGSFSDKPNVYYESTKYIVANPYANIYKEYTIDSFDNSKNDCVLCKNDSLMLGLLPLINKYTTLLCENELTLLLSNFGSRTMNILTGSDERTKTAIDKFINDVVNGEFKAIQTENILGDETFNNYATMTNSNNTIKNLIEFNQYIKAMLYNDLGIDCNYNMKRERITVAETDLNSESINTLIDNMYRNRIQFCDEINEMYGLNISVEKTGNWVDEIQIEHGEHKENEDIEEIKVEEGEENDGNEEN